MSDAVSHDAARRRFLVGSAAAGTATVASAAGAEPFAMSVGASVVLHDTRIAIDPAVVQRFVAGGTRVIALDDDPVRMWRSEVGSLLGDPATRLFGVTRWADLLIVRGLAAESRRHLRYERLDAAAGTFTWLIA